MQKQISGIYYIKNIIDGKVYVGSSCNINRRWKEHKSDLRRGDHRNGHLQNAWVRDGESNFRFGILEEVAVWFDKPTSQQKTCLKDNLEFWEQIYIDNYDASNKECGYNIYSVVLTNNLGHEYGSEHRKKLSDAIRNSSKHKAAVQNPEYRRRQSAIMKAAMNNPETRMKIRMARIGKSSWNKGKWSWNKGLKANMDDRVACNELKARAVLDCTNKCI
jgi:group I intron endonuclease